MAVYMKSIRTIAAFVLQPARPSGFVVQTEGIERSGFNLISKSSNSPSFTATSLFSSNRHLFRASGTCLSATSYTARMTPSERLSFTAETNSPGVVLTKRAACGGSAEQFFLQRTPTNNANTVITHRCRPLGCHVVFTGQQNRLLHLEKPVSKCQEQRINFADQLL